MLGKLNERYKEAIIIGAGFAGLLAAYRLLQHGYRIKLFESRNRAGGLIDTVQTEQGLAESGAHTLRSSPAMDALFQELRIEPVVARTHKKYILRNGKFCRFPLTISETLGMAARAALVPAKMHYENLRDWASHHLGAAALENLIHPMINGIYAAGPAELSPKLIFPSLVPRPGETLLSCALRQPRHPYKPSMIAPKGGMGELTEALLRAVQSSGNSEIVFGETVAAMPDSPNMIITTPAPAAAQILQKEFPTSTKVLTNVRYAPLIAATVFLDKKSHRAPGGIGVLCGANEPRRALGVLFNSSTFPHRVQEEERIASYTVMLGGTSDPEIMNLSDAELEQIIVSELHALFDLSAPPLQTVIHRWPHAIPIYSPHLAAAHQILRQDFCAKPGCILFGNYTGQISLRGMAQAFSAR